MHKSFTTDKSMEAHHATPFFLWIILEKICLSATQEIKSMANKQ